MTALETIDMVRLLLDEQRDSFFDTQLKIDAINAAQLRKLHEYYMRGDERALRPLYSTASNMQNGGVIQDTLNRRCIYPRSCRIRQHDGVSLVPIAQSVMAEYLPANEFMNYTAFNRSSATVMPRAAYYTVTKGWNGITGVLSPIIRFTANSNLDVADVWFIRMPDDYAYVNADRTADVPLSFPQEYHIEIVALAADMINDIDVEEYERGMPVFQNQIISLEELGR